MIKNIIKRDGTIEHFNPNKLIKWAEWASDSLKERVDWFGVVTDTARNFGETVHSQELQAKLIDECIYRRDWAHNLMGGKLYAALMRKEIYGDSVPTVKELFTTLYKSGFMKKLNYTEAQWEEAEQIIKHERDFEMAHFQLKQLRKKYSIQNKLTGEEFETPQFIYMRMAMALAEDEPEAIKMQEVKAWYDNFSLNKINAPTPNYVNLGTEHNGYASCCLYTVADNAASLAIGDHIAYTMTYMSAGIGGYIDTRSVGDPIRAATIIHQGRHFAPLVSNN